MDSKQFRVYNLTRKSYVSLRVVTVDDAAASLDKLLEQICEETDRGVWLKPFRGLDLLPEFPRFDLLYLDKDNQVIESPGASPSYLSGLVSGQVASVLLLPDSSIQLSATRAGDQLVIGVQSEMTRYMGLFFRPPSYSFVAVSLRIIADTFSAQVSPTPALEASSTAPIEALPQSAPSTPNLQTEHSRAHTEPHPISPELRPRKQRSAARRSLAKRKAAARAEEHQNEREPEAQQPELPAELLKPAPPIIPQQFAASHSPQKPASKPYFRSWWDSVLHPHSHISFAGWAAKTRVFTALYATLYHAASRWLFQMLQHAAIRNKDVSTGVLAPRLKSALAIAVARAGAAKLRFSQWLYPENQPQDRRRARRHCRPGLLAYYWTGADPQSHEVGDISATGFYLLTPERWLPGTMLRLTLQKMGTSGENAGDSISVWSKVVRLDLQGVGSDFILSNPPNRAYYGTMLGELVEREALERFL